MGVGGFCVIFVVFVNFVCFNGSVVAFVIFLSCWCCALVAVCLFLICFVVCACVLVVSPDVVLCLWRVCFLVCLCDGLCGGPVWADL